MNKEIIVTVNEDETKVAVLEDKKLMEIYIERSSNQRLVGNIYKGRVENVLPGMQAAFVNIGAAKNAFLYVEDVIAVRDNLKINNILKSGQQIIVQVIKEPTGDKGARVTTRITLPGRYLVLMAQSDHVGVSKRIDGEMERQRVKKIVTDLKPSGMGVVVRTAAENTDEPAIRQDMQLLAKIWSKIKNETGAIVAPALLHRDLGLLHRVIRDLFSAEISRLVINSEYEYEKILELLDTIDPKLKLKVDYDEQKESLEYAGIEPEIKKALKSRVWLKGGAGLVIDQTEALTTIDVNTGKFVGDIDLEATVVDTNLKAVPEIARQLRLRNIGGIIIIDFIDMVQAGYRQQVLNALAEAVKRDKTQVNILGITQLGLVELTRKKERPSLSEMMQKPCPCCQEQGRVLSEETISIQLKNQIIQTAKRTAAATILVEVHPLVAAKLIGKNGVSLRKMERTTGKKIYIRGCTGYQIEQVTVHSF